MNDKYTDEEARSRDVAKAWAGLSLYVQDLRHAIREMETSAFRHPHGNTPRMVVYKAQLDALLELADAAPARHAEAVACWLARENDPERQALLTMHAGIERVVRKAEEILGRPPGAERLSLEQKVEGIIGGLIAALEARQAIQATGDRRQATGDRSQAAGGREQAKAENKCTS